MINEFTADFRGKTLRAEAGIHAFARRRKIESPIPHDNRRAVVAHRRPFVCHPWFVKIVPYRVNAYAKLISTWGQPAREWSRGDANDIDGQSKIEMSGSE
jgi:hypothetical protein